MKKGKRETYRKLGVLVGVLSRLRFMEPNSAQYRSRKKLLFSFR